MNHKGCVRYRYVYMLFTVKLKAPVLSSGRILTRVTYTVYVEVDVNLDGCQGQLCGADGDG